MFKRKPPLSLVKPNPITESRGDLSAIERATQKWQEFYSALGDVDKIVLDKAAAGHKLKVVCYEHDVPYDTLQKRFKRWQDQLGLPSLQVLLYVWRIVRTTAAKGEVNLPEDSVPTLMRFAPEIALEVAMREHAGYHEISLPAALRAQAIRPSSTAAEIDRRAHAAERMTECVMSPALWLALLSVGQEVGGAGLQRAVVPAQHQLFLQMLGTADPADLPDTSVASLFAALDRDEYSSSGQWGAGAPVALPLVLTARAMGLLARFTRCDTEAMLRAQPPMQQRIFWESRVERIKYAAYDTRNDVALWQRFCAIVHDPAAAADLLRGVTLDIVLGPLTGLAVAIVARAPRFAAQRETFARMYSVVVRARLRHAQHFGIHPVRLLGYFAMEDAGIPTHSTHARLGPDESIVTTVDIKSAVNQSALRRTISRTQHLERPKFVRTSDPMGIL